MCSKSLCIIYTCTMNMIKIHKMYRFFVHELHIEFINKYLHTNKLIKNITLPSKIIRFLKFLNHIVCGVLGGRIGSSETLYPGNFL